MALPTDRMDSQSSTKTMTPSSQAPTRVLRGPLQTFPARSVKARTPPERSNRATSPPKKPHTSTIQMKR